MIKHHDSLMSSKNIAAASCCFVLSVSLSYNYIMNRRLNKHRVPKRVKHRRPPTSTPTPTPTPNPNATPGNTQSRTSCDSNTFPMTPIGTLSTPFPLCVGTPRQSSLCPSITSTLKLDQTRVGVGIVDGLENFTWVWIIWVFHRNNNWFKVDAGNANASNSHTSTSTTPTASKPTEFDGISSTNKHDSNRHYVFPSKIAPPSLGGARVGILSTRSPHRPNPIGMSLVKLEEIILPSKKNNKRFELILSGVDLVDGTPILDVKPYVPNYDSVGFYEYRSALRHCRSLPVPPPTLKEDDVSAFGGSSLILPEGRIDCPLPSWLSVGLSRRRVVEWNLELEGGDDVVSFLAALLSRSKKTKFYKKKPAQYKKMVEEVLAVDVRSKHQTSKLRKGGFVQRNKEGEGKVCCQILDGLSVVFNVIEQDEDRDEDREQDREQDRDEERNGGAAYNHDNAAKGSGCDDICVIVGITIYKVE